MTEEPTPEQIEAAARGIYALDPWLAGGDRRFSAYPNLRWEELGKDDQEIYTTQARAALVAAAGATPQELTDSESEALKAAAQPYAHTFHRDGKAGLYVQIRNLPRIVAEMRGGGR